MLSLAATQDYFPDDAPRIKAGFGEADFHGETMLHPLGLLALLTLGAWLLVCRRRSAILPFLVMTSFVAVSQRIVIAGLDFNLLRALAVAGTVRLLVRSEWRGLRITPADWAILAWISASSFAYVALRGPSALVFQLGVAFDVLSAYVLLRCWIRDRRDVDAVLSWLPWLAILSAPLFARELTSGQNMFSVFGGANPITMVREGRVRCQGPFVHPILAGCYWATLLPLIGITWWRPRTSRPVTLMGVGAALFIIVASASSTPIFAAAASVGAAMMFVVRRYLGVIRASVVAGLVGLHLVMKAPVWHLIARVGAAGGSTAYHRYRLIDCAIRNFNEWAVLGTRSTAHWGHQMFDLTNQYVKEGVRGGLLGLVLFVTTIYYGFRNVGFLVRRSGRHAYSLAMSWGLGCTLFTQCVMFIGISITHAKQNYFVWFLVLAMINSVAASERALARRTRPVRRRVAQPWTPRVA